MTSFDAFEGKKHHTHTYFENIVGKGKKFGNQHFLLFHNVSFPMKKTNFMF